MTDAATPAQPRSVPIGEEVQFVRDALRDQPAALAVFESHIGHDREALGFVLAANIGPIRVAAIEAQARPAVASEGLREALALLVEAGVEWTPETPDSGARCLWCGRPWEFANTHDADCPLEQARAALAAAPAGVDAPDMDFDEVTDGIIERGLRKALKQLVEAVDRLDDPTFTVTEFTAAIEEARAAAYDAERQGES